MTSGEASSAHTSSRSPQAATDASPLSDRNLRTIRVGKPWLKRGNTEPGDLGPPPENPCRPVWTFGANTKCIKVRCVCMSELKNPSPRFYGYDHLGFADSVPEAVKLWEAHRDGR